MPDGHLDRQVHSQTQAVSEAVILAANAPSRHPACIYKELVAQ